jgi:hypothetical protein
MSKTVWLAVPLLLIVPCGSNAAEKTKPECTERTRGKLWPEKTARGAAVPVEICAPKGWHYRWQQLTIDISQLRAATKRKEELAVLPAAHKSVRSDVD